MKTDTRINAMERKSKIQRFILIFAIVNILFIQGHIFDSPTSTNEINTLLSSKYHVGEMEINNRIANSLIELDDLIEHDPIFIDGNVEFHVQAATEGWDLAGIRDGSLDNPYLISGYTIINKDVSNLIDIRNTDIYFEITNNNIDGIGGPSDGRGISFKNVKNGQIINNYISGEDFGILLDSSSNNNVLSLNTAFNNKNGIYLYSSLNNTLTNNTAFNNTNGIYLSSSSDNNTLTNNTAFNNIIGIYLYSSSNNTLTSNTAINNGIDGIYLYSSSNNNVMSLNTAFNNTNGIYLSSFSNNNTLTNNTAYNNSEVGIYISSSYNILSSNTAYSNLHSGIKLYVYSRYNVLNGNTVFNNGIEGIEIISSSNNIIRSNIAYNNSRSGIRLFSSSNNNILSGNTFYNNSEYGIYMVSSSDNNVLSFNTVYNNPNGGILISFSSNNTLSSNTVYNNSGYAIKISSFADNNEISWNNFLNNAGTSQAYDSGLNNNFHHNYFDDHVSPDLNGDKIADDVYSIDGSSSNNDSNALSMQYIMQSPIILSPNSGFYGITIDISWSNAIDNYNHSVIYTVYYSSYGGLLWHKIPSDSQTNNTSWDITKIVNGTYIIKIVAQSSQGLILEVQSNLFDIIQYIPTEPLNVNITRQAGYTTLRWDTPSRTGSALIFQYNVYRKNSTAEYQWLISTSNLRYDDFNVILGQSYYYIVKAVNIIGEGKTSQPVNIWYAITPSTPLNLQGVVSSSIISLSWDSPTSDGGDPISAYRVYKGTVPGEFTEYYDTNNLWYDDTNIELAITYYYTIAAVNSIGNSMNSSEIAIHDSTLPIFTVDSLGSEINYVRGNLTIVVFADDANGINRVVFSIRGGSFGNTSDTEIRSITQAPYSVTLDTTSLEDTDYIIFITVYDNAGNFITQDFIIDVNNTIDTTLPSEDSDTASNEDSVTAPNDDKTLDSPQKGVKDPSEFERTAVIGLIVITSLGTGVVVFQRIRR